ncbi:thioesterase superfamily protein [Zymoseptoria brevis]|uniref:Thioesterase superfamily protein n=1 Tax=Zymoseptoria brevis TaxID=1047168 RepID=A0A0F4GR92_9PEZI|nr:thioesterase superfamily protein [Zymoseptoria brevis]
MSNELESQSPFLREPWLASQLQHPDTVIRVTPSRESKVSTEDSLFAEILKTDRTIQSCLSFYLDHRSSSNSASSRSQNAEGREAESTAKSEDGIGEVTTLIAMGNGMNGHPQILHGGITATLIDESMGIFQSVNHSYRTDKMTKGPEESFAGTFTAQLTVRYLAPVRTPGCVEVKVRSVKREPRKEWLKAEVRQWVGDQEGGEAVVVADGEALFIQPRVGPRAAKI